MAAQAHNGGESSPVIAATFAEHQSVLTETVAHLSEPLVRAASILVAAYLAGGKVILFGNGGSMSDALHIEGELVNRFHVDRAGVAAVALGSPGSLTATANDYSYEDAFQRMLQAHHRPGDVALGLSTSGNSENVVRALAWGRAHGLQTIALTGAGGGRCAEVADALLDVPSRNTPRIQEMHIVMGHILCDLVEKAILAAR